MTITGTIETGSPLCRSAPLLEIPLLYHDDRILIINKPAGLAVHAGGRGVAHLGSHLDALRFDQPESPQLARRISLPLYYQQPPIAAEASPPPHMIAKLAACGY